MKNKTILQLANEVVEHSKQLAQFSKAHVCRSSVNSFLHFLRVMEIKDPASFTFRQLTPELLHAYQQWLFDSGNAYNTVSTYIRNLQTLYNEAVERKFARYSRNLFRNLAKGYENNHHRIATSSDLQSLSESPTPALHKAQSPPSKSHTTYKYIAGTHKTQLLFWLQLQLCGIPFVDLVHLRVCDVDGDYLCYRRQKTGVFVRLHISNEAKRIIQTLRRHDAAPTDYLLDILPSGSSMRTERGWYQYQSCLMRYNKYLRHISNAIGTDTRITSYVARHTWADRAQRCGMDTKMIMELLGHSRITTTLHYLRSFERENISSAQLKVQQQILSECAFHNPHVS